MSHVPLRATIEQMAPGERVALKKWYDEGNVLLQGKKDGRYGLWIAGPRRYGTSYLAECAVNRLVRSAPDLEWEHVHALALTHLVRTYWNQQDMVRHHPDDYSLHLEMQDTERMFDRLWFEAEVVWLDDFHDTAVDVAFWCKHIQPHIERRIKDRKPTVIATTLLPDDPRLSGLVQVIKDLFVICPASLPVVERNAVG